MSIDLSNGRDDSRGFRSDLIAFDLDPAEAHVLEAALAIYRGQLDEARRLGGPALEAAVVMDPVALRVQMRLVDRLYGTGDIPEPDWSMPESADPITAAKGREDFFAGDHHIYPNGVGR